VFCLCCKSGAAQNGILSPDSPAGLFLFDAQKMKLRPAGTNNPRSDCSAERKATPATPRSSLSFWKAPRSVSGLFSLDRSRLKNWTIVIAPATNVVALNSLNQTTLSNGTDRWFVNLPVRGWVEVNMNRRDRELLDRQMRRFQPSPRPFGLITLILAGAFLVGMIAGSIFTSQQPVQTASTDGKTALAFLLNGTRGEPR
jgi:hypothetical protein